MTKKQLTLSIIAIIILTLIGGGIFWYWNKYQGVSIKGQGDENQPAEIVNIEDLSSIALATEDWQTYRNEEYGFELRYPREWELSEEYKQYSSHNVIAIKKMFINQYGGDDGSIIKINIYPVDNNKGVIEWLDKFFSIDSETSTLHKISNIKITSIDAIYRVITSNVSGGYFNDIAFQNNNNIYYIEIISRILSKDQKNTEQHNSDISSILDSINFF